MAKYIGAIDCAAGANHAAVKELRGFSFIGSGAGVFRLRHGAVDGQILRHVNVPATGAVSEVFPEAFKTPSGVYVQAIAGTISEGVLLNGG